MAKIKENLVQELERMVLNSAKKREMLLQSAHLRSRIKKNLSIFSGSLSLLSAGAITMVLVRYIGNSGIQVIAAITAGVSGTISLVITGYYKEDETSKIFVGSSKYLALRDKAYRTIIHPNISNEEVYKMISTLQSEYAELDRLYSPFIKIFQSRRMFFISFGGNRSQSSQPPLIHFKFNRNKAAYSAIDQAVATEISNLRNLLNSEL